MEGVSRHMDTLYKPIANTLPYNNVHKLEMSILFQYVNLSPKVTLIWYQNHPDLNYPHSVIVIGHVE